MTVFRKAVLDLPFGIPGNQPGWNALPAQQRNAFLAAHNESLMNIADARISGILTDVTVLMIGDEELICSTLLEYIYARAMRPSADILTQGALAKGTMPHMFARVEKALYDLGFKYTPMCISAHVSIHSARLKAGRHRHHLDSCACFRIRSARRGLLLELLLSKGALGQTRALCTCALPVAA